MNFESLEGKKILSVSINPSKDLLQFETNEGIYCFRTVGDCCSESWIEHVNNLKALINQTIEDIDEIHKEDEEDSYCDEYIRIYIYQFLTPLGIVEFEMRNKSNGFYGGFIEETSINHLLPEEMMSLKPLTKDF